MTSVVVGLGVAAGVAAIYKVLTSNSGSVSIFNFRLSWGR